MARLVAIVALFFLAIPANAGDNSIVGTWKIQSFFREVIATGVRQNEFGEKPSGYISYQPEPNVRSARRRQSNQARQCGCYG
jgi:hypothetical protein